MSFQTQFQIGSHHIGRPSAPKLIAEIACAHGGDADECRRLIDASAGAGADIIQLQVFRAHLQAPASHKLRPILDSLELDEKTWHSLFAHAQATGCAVSAFVYDEESLDVVRPCQPDLLKLNSADLNYPPMLEQSAKTGIPISLGTGASTMEEIAAGLEILDESGADKVFLMHGVQDFPTNVPDARMNRIGLLHQLWGLPMGYADHTDGADPLAPWIDLVAIGRGASVLEKHITIDRSLEKTDYQAALEPQTWKAYADSIRQAAKALGDTVPVSVTEADLRYRRFQKKVAFAARDLSKGEVIKGEDLKFMRSDAAPGLSPLEARVLVGTSVPDPISLDEIIPVSWSV